MEIVDGDIIDIWAQLPAARFWREKLGQYP